jgi:uncharacterized protein (TIGR03437 family)
MFRFLFVLAAITPFSFSQTLPAINWIKEVDASGLDTVAGLTTDAQGDIYIVGSTLSPTFPVKAAVQNHLASHVGHNTYVTKLDPSGNIIYSTYFGGNGDDLAAALTVDTAGAVYVGGSTTSTNFPVTSGAYLTSSNFTGNSLTPTFLFKLNPEGSVGYSTYFAPMSLTAIAVDGAGSAYLTGSTPAEGGLLPITPGAYQSVCACGVIGEIGPAQLIFDGFVTKFDTHGSTLLYSTYLGEGIPLGSSLIHAIALASDGSAYVAGPTAIIRLNSTGSSLLASHPAVVSAAGRGIAIGSDGNVYIAGAPENFHTTPSAFQTNSPSLPPLEYEQPAGPAALLKLDPELQNVLAATYFGGGYGQQVQALALDPSGNVYIAGNTGVGLPARTPFQDAFSPSTGFLSELSNDFSTLLFSTYLGDNQVFGVQGLAIGAHGAIVIGGSTETPANAWVNSIDVPPSPSLRIDSVVNAASLVDGGISAGETIVVRGAGFGNDAQLSIGGAVIQPISVSSTEITAVVPSNLPSAVEFRVQSGGATSNEVAVPVVVTSPGLFSVNRSGVGQGYILNQDGRLNSPSNPAAPGDHITLYVIGVGPVTSTDGYAVTATLAAVFIEGIYCDGVAAVMGPVKGFPGSVYQLTIIAPTPQVNPNFSGYGVILQIGAGASQNGLSVSISQ